MVAATINADAQAFWKAVAQWPEDVQRSFWEAGQTLSAYIGENPSPRLLELDTSRPPPGMPWWEKILFIYGQSQHNQAVATQMQAQATVEGGKWLWGALQGDFNKSPTTGQIVTGGLISMIPFVDQLCDVRDVVANCMALDTEEQRADPENWFALGLTCIGFVPEIGSAVKTVAKSAMHSGARLIDVIKHMEWIERLVAKLKVPWGRAPMQWLRKFDWMGAAKAAGSAAKGAFENALKKVEAAAKWAVGAIKQRLLKLADTFKAVIARVEAAIRDAAAKVRDKVRDLLDKDKKEIGKYDATPGAAPNKHVQGESEPPKGPPRKPPTMEPHKPKCFKPGDDLRKNWKDDPRKLEKEFYEQLKGQEKGLNDLTVKQYLDNRAEYEKIGRGSAAAQEAKRQRLTEEINQSVLASLENRGILGKKADEIASAKTAEIMSSLAALHDPDMVVGGEREVARFGDRKVNSSIGSQWAKESRVAEMDRAAQDALKRYGPDAKMNVSLDRCK